MNPHPLLMSRQRDNKRIMRLEKRLAAKKQEPPIPSLQAFQNIQDPIYEPSYRRHFQI